MRERSTRYSFFLDEYSGLCRFFQMVTAWVGIGNDVPLVIQVVGLWWCELGSSTYISRQFRLRPSATVGDGSLQGSI